MISFEDRYILKRILSEDPEECNYIAKRTKIPFLEDHLNTDKRFDIYR